MTAPRDPQTRSDLAAHLARVRHDLGRYVVFQQRWLAESASDAERCAAVEADLLETRRGPEGTVDAATLWAELRRPLVGETPLIGGGRVDLSDDPDFASLDEAMGRVGQAIAAIRRRESPDGSAAFDVATACDRLWRRWRTEAP